MYRFANQPTSQDFQNLATYLEEAQQGTLHQSLWETRTQVIDRLRAMAQQPQRDEHQSAYHALRLFVWN